jgi:hypothetical protein
MFMPSEKVKKIFSNLSWQVLKQWYNYRWM